MTLILWLRRYWKPLAVFLLLMMVWLHGDHNGAQRVDSRWQLATMTASAKAARNAVRAEQAARKQEQDWSAAFDLTANMYQESYSELEKKRDRIMRDVAAGRLRVPSACPRLPEAAADSGQPQAAEAGGQSGLAGTELVTRLAVCDEVVLERNQAVELLRAERQ